MMRAIFALFLIGCASAPAEYVRPGESPIAVQMRADSECIAWLAEGVQSPRGLIRRRGAACAFGWRDRICTCRTLAFHNDGVDVAAGWSGETVTFSACAQMRARGELQ